MVNLFSGVVQAFCLTGKQQTANGLLMKLFPVKGTEAGKFPTGHVKIIESTPEKVVVHWRYLPNFSGKNPHVGVSSIKFVDEYFTISPTGEVTRTVRKGAKKIDDWHDPLKRATQKSLLTPKGISRIN
ncbi:MAG: hypothetical protein B5M54_05545 [Candidatus Aminicenantes bacterium 4484_214]|nr:MAG: hypothetical protein B5M54_05545 [Candidatus Aminicenantes bacterium 4484_214]